MSSCLKYSFFLLLSFSLCHGSTFEVVFQMCYDLRGGNHSMKVRTSTVKIILFYLKIPGNLFVFMELSYAI